MTKYPNREALRKAHDIYRDAMRQFIVQCLKRVRGERVEDLICNSLDGWEKKQFKQHLQQYEGPEASIDIDHFPKIIRRCWSRDRAFKQEFDLNSKIQYKTGTIVESRNFWAHPGIEDVELAHTQANLTLVAEVLGEIKNQGAKQAVESIRDQLFSDEVEEHPLEAENAACKEQIADMAKELEAANAEKTKYRKALKAASNQLATLKSVNAQLEERLEVTSTRLEGVEAELTACKKDLARTLSQLEGTKAGQTEYLSLEERLALLKGNGKTTTSRRGYLSPEERLARALTESEKEETEEERVEIAKQVAELRLNPDASKKMSWKNIREEVLLTSDEFHKIIRISDYYKEVMLDRLGNLIDEGWVYNGSLNILCGFDVPEEFVERMESNKAKAKVAEAPSYRGDTVKSQKSQRKWRRPGAVAALRDPAEIREAEAKIANILNPREKTRLERELREAKRAVYGSEI